jgi:hypothetical protein
MWRKMDQIHSSEKAVKWILFCFVSVKYKPYFMWNWNQMLWFVSQIAHETKRLYIISDTNVFRISYSISHTFCSGEYLMKDWAR